MGFSAAGNSTQASAGAATQDPELPVVDGLTPVVLTGGASEQQAAGAELPTCRNPLPTW